jgi:hypothetical protein
MHIVAVVERDAGADVEAVVERKPVDAGVDLAQLP